MRVRLDGSCESKEGDKEKKYHSGSSISVRGCQAEI